MKKLFITMLMAVAATASFAQNPKIGKEIKATKDYNAGLELLNSQIATLTEEQKGIAYVELYKLAKPAFDKGLEAVGAGKGTDAEYKDMMNCINAVVEAAKYGAKDADKLYAEIAQYRAILINAANSANDNNDKLAYSLCYINSSKGADQHLPLAAFFAAYSYYQAKDYPNAAKYAKMALGNETVNDMAEQVYVASNSADMKTKADTIQYVNAMKEVNPTKYFPQIVQALNEIGETAEADKLISEELARNPQNKLAYYVRGTKELTDRKFDEAIADFKKVVEIDPEYVNAWYNLGVCASQKGYDLNEKYTDKNGRIAKDKAEEVTVVLKEAITYYEKVRELDPSHEKITNWPMQLRMLYNAVGETEKANEISKMLGDM